MTKKAVYVCRDYKEKQMQRALLQYNKRENYPLVREALRLTGREDLIGNSPDCLIKDYGAKSAGIQKKSSLSQKNNASRGKKAPSRRNESKKAPVKTSREAQKFKKRQENKRNAKRK